MLVPDTSSLPIIDISPFLVPIPPTGLTPSQRQTAKDMHKACKDIGFFYVTQHGVPESTIKHIHTLASTFFALSETQKEAYSIRKGDGGRGYQRLGENVTQYASDWHEGFDVYRPRHPSDSFLSTGVLSGTNPYPSKEFQETVESYVEVMKGLGKAMMTAMACGLGVDPGVFDGPLSDSFWVLRLIGYPPLDKTKTDGISCGEHTDYGCLTILNQDDTPGALHVKTKAGDWIVADPIPGTFVINIGDMVNVWTNGEYQSTPHKVIHTAPRTRTSVPFFYEPNFDAIVKPLPECVERTGGVERYAAVQYGSHLLSKVSNNFTQ